MNYFNSHNEAKKALLSTLWIFVLINVLFRDLHEFLQAGAFSQITTDALTGMGLLAFAGGIILQLQIAMVALSRMLPETINRWANLLVATLSVLLVLTTDHKGVNDVFFSSVQVVGLISICWVALSTMSLEDVINFIDRPTSP